MKWLIIIAGLVLCWLKGYSYGYDEGYNDGLIEQYYSSAEAILRVIEKRREGE